MGRRVMLSIVTMVVASVDAVTWSFSVGAEWDFGDRRCVKKRTLGMDFL